MRCRIRLKNISRRFGPQTVLSNVSYAFPRHGFFGLLGPSGSGKSTLLNILAGLDAGYEGECWVERKRWKEMSDSSRTEYRLQHIGYVFQNFNLLELDDAISNVLLPLEALYGTKGKYKKRKALDLLSFVGLEKKAKQTIHTLSGGEKQRVAIARALANDPDILLADEPSGSLDEENARIVFSLLSQIAKKRLVIVVSHDASLLRSYADKILHLRGGSLVQEEVCSNLQASITPATMNLGYPKIKSRVPSFFLLTHAFHLLKAKRKRALVSLMAISMGLLGLGLSIYVSSSVSGQLTGAFASIVPEDCIVMSPNQEGPSPITNVYGARVEEAQYIANQYRDDVKGWGSSFLMDYEGWFSDDNEFYVTSGVNRVVLPGLSVRSVNDFLWLDDYETMTFYPSRPVNMGVEEVVLGLPYATMFNLCYGLHILRNYQALGDYIKIYGLHAILAASHIDWGFQDEEIFSVLAVAPSQSPVLFHTDHFWNRKIILDRMRFRSSQTEDSLTPQYVFELPYVEPRGNVLDFLYRARRDERLSSLVYEKASSYYLQSVCPLDQECAVNRLYLYGADKNGLRWNELDRALELFPEIEGRTLVTQGSYYAQAGVLVSGFLQKFYLSNSSEDLDTVIDSASFVLTAHKDLPLELPESIEDGQYLAASTGGLRLSADLSRVRVGRKPVGLEEVVLSKGLMEKWGNPELIYLAAQTQEDAVGEYTSRRFVKKELKVVGSSDDSRDILYVPSDWTVDYFSSVLGMSSFYLEPSGAMFHLRSGSDVPSLLGRMRKAFPQYRFSSPSLDIASSIEETVGYVGDVLTVFSSIALSMSALLFIVVMSITVTENAGEAHLFHVLGIRSNDIVRSYFAHCLLYGFGAALIASTGLLACQFIVSAYLANAFSSALSFIPAWQPFAFVGAALFAFCFLSRIALWLFFRIKTERLPK